MPGMTAALRGLVGEHSCMSIVLGQVHVEDGKSSHWERTDEGNIIVSVQLAASAIPVWANLSDIGGLRIPVVGTEVVVAHYGGIEGVAVIIGTIPKVSQAIAEHAATKRLIIDDQVWIYDGSGTPVSLVTASEFNDHTHNPPNITGQATYAAGVNALFSTSTPDSIDGTDIVKGK